MNINSQSSTGFPPVVERLYGHLMCSTQLIDVSSESWLDFVIEGQGSCIYLLSGGYVDLVRKLDNMVVSTFSQREIIGMTAIFTPIDLHVLRIVRSATVHALPVSAAVAIIDRHNLWQAMAIYFSRLLADLYHRDIAVLRHKAHDIVTENIFLLLSLPQALRDESSVVQFISERNVISSRTIHSIISKLKNEGRIKVINGRLNAVTGLSKG